MKNSNWMDTKTLAEEFGIALSTQAKYRANRSIPFSKVGGFIRYSRKKIEAWLENHSMEVRNEQY